MSDAYEIAQQVVASWCHRTGVSVTYGEALDLRVLIEDAMREFYRAKREEDFEALKKIFMGHAGQRKEEV
jgi:hypothetical protein